MIFRAETRDGRPFLLGSPKTAVFSYDADAPADSLLVRFPVDFSPPPLTRIFALRGGNPFFSGIVDEQNLILTGTGLTLELSARSFEAILLDSEARPGEILSPGAASIAERFLTPLGLKWEDEAKLPPFSPVTVEKGTSVWEVLTSILGNNPYFRLTVNDRGGVCLSPIVERKIFLKDISSAEVSRLPCEEISEVVLQSSRGSYDTVYRSGTSAVPRIRYVSLGSARQPKRLIKESEEKNFRVKITTQAALFPVLGCLFSFNLKNIGNFRDLPVISAKYELGINGERTLLTLGRPQKTEV